MRPRQQIPKLHRSAPSPFDLGEHERYDHRIFLGGRVVGAPPPPYLQHVTEHAHPEPQVAGALMLDEHVDEHLAALLSADGHADEQIGFRATQTRIDIRAAFDTQSSPIQRLRHRRRQLRFKERSDILDLAKRQANETVVGLRDFRHTQREK